MMNRPVAPIAKFLPLFLFAALVIAPVYAQVPTPAPSASAPPLVATIENRVSDLEGKVAKAEIAQTHLIAALTANNDQNRFLLTAFGTALAALVVIQSILTYVQLQREGKRDARQNDREDERDKLDRSGIERVSRIMEVVRETISNRLDAEKDARAVAKDAQERLEKVLEEVHDQAAFYRTFRTTIQNERNVVEALASQLALVPRHEFRQRAVELGGFAQRFDTFKRQFEPLAEEPRPQLDPRALYIRGVAAHYANQPDIARDCLAEVTKTPQSEPGEPDKAYKRRIANAHYYLGVTQSNFGNHQIAVDSFDHAINLDPDSTDFLTKIAGAEAYFMKGADDFSEVSRLLSEVEQGLQRKTNKRGHLAGVFLRLQSRVALIRANMEIVARKDDWKSHVQNILQPTCTDDPNYYYATTTLAQVVFAEEDADSARKLFVQSYENIERSGDLVIVTEVRSLILLRMVAGLCCRKGFMNDKRSDEHLDRAEALLGALPRIDGQVCTVFSTLSKRNERSEVILEHLNLIRSGGVLTTVN